MNGVFEAQVSLLGSTGSGQEVVQHVKASLSSRHRGNATAFQSVIDNLATNQSRVHGRRSVILQFQEKSGFGCCLGGQGLRGGECVEKEGSIG